MPLPKRCIMAYRDSGGAPAIGVEQARRLSWARHVCNLKKDMRGTPSPSNTPFGHTKEENKQSFLQTTGQMRKVSRFFCLDNGVHLKTSSKT